MLLAQIEPTAILPLVDRFGFSVLTVGAFALAIRALWSSLQTKETAHRAEREADRTAHLATLGSIAGDVKQTSTQIAEVRRDVERIADRLAVPPAPALRSTGHATLATLFALALLGLVVLLAGCSRTVDVAQQADAAAAAASSSTSSTVEHLAEHAERSRDEAPSTTTTRKVIERFVADTFDAGEEAPPAIAAPSSRTSSHPAGRLVERETTDTTTTTGAVAERERVGMAAEASTVSSAAASSAATAHAAATEHAQTKAGIPWGLLLVGAAALLVAAGVAFAAMKFNLPELAKRALGSILGR